MKRILLAEDHAPVRKGLKQIINDEFADVHITEAEDGYELITALKKDRFDLVISDLSMPVMTGLEALPYIKQMNALLPVLILSTHPAAQYSGVVEAAGAEGYLEKDAASEQLVGAISALLKGGRYFLEEKGVGV